MHLHQPKQTFALKWQIRRADVLWHMTPTRRPGGERGTSILELALLAPVMVLIVMGVLDLARGYQMQIRLENAAREGAAFAQLYPNNVSGCPETGDIETRVTDEDAGLASMEDFEVTVSKGDGSPVSPDCDGTGPAAERIGPGARVRVEVSATFDVITPMVEHVVGSALELTGSSEVQVQGTVEP